MTLVVSAVWFTPGRPKGYNRVTTLSHIVWLLLGIVLLIGSSACGDVDPPPNGDLPSPYTQQEASPGGTGKVYMGREIAQVTSDSTWLERPEREVSEFPNRVVEALALQPSDVVADIGAGTGYYTFRLSPYVPQGKVLAVDIQPEMLDQIGTRAQAEGISNVVPVLGSVTFPRLPPDSIDVALIVFSYTEFSHPQEMIEAIEGGLRPGGRLVLVEYRGEDLTLPVDPLHRITEAQLRREIEATGLVWSETKDVLPQQHFMVFEKPVR